MKPHGYFLSAFIVLPNNYPSDTVEHRVRVVQGLPPSILTDPVDGVQADEPILLYDGFDVGSLGYTSRAEVLAPDEFGGYESVTHLDGVPVEAVWDGCWFEGEVDPGCGFTVDRLGQTMSARWSVVSQGVPSEVLATDELRFWAISADEVDFDVVFPFEERAQMFFSPGPAGSFPVDWVPPRGEPIYLGETGALSLAVYPFERAAGRPVSFAAGQIAVDFNVPGIIRKNEGPDPSNAFKVLPDLVEGGGTQVDVVFDGQTQTVRSFVFVAPQDVVSTEIVPVYHLAHNDMEQWGPPAGLRVLHRDHDGHVVFDGSPTVEVIEGSIGIGRILEVGGPYYALYDVCDGPALEPEPRSVTIKVSSAVTRMADREVTHTFEWTVHPGDPPIERPDGVQCEGPGNTSEDTDGGCGCSAKRPASPLAAALFLPVLAGLRRRRKAPQATAQAAT